MEILSREIAKIIGSVRFFTGKPCKHGHMSERFTSTGSCVECGRNQSREIYGRAFADPVARLRDQIEALLSRADLMEAEVTRTREQARLLTLKMETVATEAAQEAERRSIALAEHEARKAESVRVAALAQRLQPLRLRIPHSQVEAMYNAVSAANLMRGLPVTARPGKYTDSSGGVALYPFKAFPEDFDQLRAVSMQLMAPVMATPADIEAMRAEADRRAAAYASQ